jgi:hypothetical protein
VRELKQEKKRFDREEQGRDQEEQVSWLRGENDAFVRASGGGREDSASREQDDPQLTASSASSSTPSPRLEDVKSSKESQKNSPTNPTFLRQPVGTYPNPVYSNNNNHNITSGGETRITILSLYLKEVV